MSRIEELRTTTTSVRQVPWRAHLPAQKPEAAELSTETPSSGSPSLDVCEVRDDAGELLEPDHPDYEELKELLPDGCDD